ncbi:uncharacterized protein LOC121383174 isoform X2 [Gigantopelta aegis]|nr:uncharacterized protein LOC121383174 isoform X2 [Gigantopelta aegis]
MTPHHRLQHNQQGQLLRKQDESNYLREQQPLHQQTKTQQSTTQTFWQQDMPGVVSKDSSVRQYQPTTNQLPRATPVVSKDSSVRQYQPTTNQLPRATPLVSKDSSVPQYQPTTNQLPRATPVVSKDSSVRQYQPTTNQLSRATPLVSKDSSVRQYQPTTNQLARATPLVSKDSSVPQYQSTTNQLARATPLVSKDSSVPQYQPTTNQLSRATPLVSNDSSVRQYQPTTNQLARATPLVSKDSSVRQYQPTTNQLAQATPLVSKDSSVPQFQPTTNQLPRATSLDSAIRRVHTGLVSDSEKLHLTPSYRDALVSVYLNSVIKNNQSSDISNPPKATVMTTNTKSPDVFTKRHYQPCSVKNNAVNGPEKGRNLQDEVKDNLSKAAVTITSNAKDVKSTEAVKVNNVWWPPSKIIPNNVKYINPVNDPIEIDCEDDDDSGNTTLQQKKKLVILIDDETDIDDKDAKKEKNLTAHSMTSITQLLNSDVNSKHRLNFETDARPRYTYSVEKKNIDLDPVSPQVKSNTPAIVSKTNQLNKDVKRRTKLTEYAAESAPFLSSVAVQKQSLVSSTGDHISTAVASKDKDIIISETTASMPMSEIDTNSAIASKEKNIVSELTAFMPISEMDTNFTVASKDKDIIIISEPTASVSISEIDTNSVIASKEKNIVSEPTAFMPISEMDTNSTVASKDKDIIIISEPTASVSISEIDTNATSGIVLLEAFSLQPEFDASEYSTDDLEHGTTKQHHVPQDHQLALSRKAFFCCGLNGCTFATIMPVELEVHQLQFHSRSSHFDCVHCGYVASKPSLLIDHLHGHIYPDNEMDKFDGHCNYFQLFLQTGLLQRFIIPYLTEALQGDQSSMFVVQRSFCHMFETDESLETKHIDHSEMSSLFC